MIKEKLEDLKQTHGEEIMNEEFILTHGPREKFSKELKNAWKIEFMEDSEVQLKVTWHLFMILYYRPHKL